MKSKLFSLFLICWLLLLACTEDIKPKSYTYSKLLTGEKNKTWKINRMVLRKEGEIDVTQNLRSCAIDDRYIFYANSEKVFEVKNGSQKCDLDEDALLLTYTWSLNNANATINMVMPHIFDYYLVPLIVKKMDERDMELEIFINEEATVSYVFQFRRTDEE